MTPRTDETPMITDHPDGWCRADFRPGWFVGSVTTASREDTLAIVRQVVEQQRRKENPCAQNS